MEQYYEQSVAGKQSLRSGALYVLSWMLVVVFVLVAMIFAANITGSDPNELTINWMSIIGLVICLAIAGILFVRKDYLRMEYDYIYRDGVLGIFGVMNRRRRKRLGQIDIRRIHSFGPVSALKEAGTGMRRHKWYAKESRYYITYIEENIRHIALLELDDEFAALLRRQMSVGTWRDTEGKN